MRGDNHQTRETQAARPRSRELMTGVMPLPAMYEFLRENLDYVDALNAARQILADDRSTEIRPAS